MKTKKVCKNCKYFKYLPQTIIAPIENIKADGLCENSRWKEQPIVLDSNTDNCDSFIKRQ